MKRIFAAFLSLLALLSSFKVSALSVGASAAVLIAGDTAEILFASNENARLPMASTTKIMTALLLCESGQFEREITVTEEMVRVEGSSMGLLPGDTVSLEALLYGLMLSSGNDAAQAVAITLSGSSEKFVEKMNLRAEQLGLCDTHFETPSGLDSQHHYTTAFELALLAREAMKNPLFAAAVSAPRKTVSFGNPPYRRTLKNHNKLLSSLDGVIGIKTGFTKKSGRCLVSAMKRDGRYLIAVTLNCPNDWAEHKSMLEYGLPLLTYASPKAPQLPKLSCIGGTASEITLTASEITFSYLSEESISTRLNIPKSLCAPLSKDKPVGTVDYYCGNNFVKSAKVYPSADVPKRKIGFLQKLFLLLYLNLKYF